VSRRVGAAFEQLAADYLARRGIRVVERNFTCKGGELDLVCDDAGTLVFVEVRARAGDAFGSPAETVGSVKRRRLVRAAQVYLHQRALYDRPCRFDVVAVLDGVVTHYPDAFATNY
jgi:putative endonuclease